MRVEAVFTDPHPVRLSKAAQALCTKRGVRIERRETIAAYPKTGNFQNPKRRFYYVALRLDGRALFQDDLLRKLLETLADDEIMGKDA